MGSYKNLMVIIMATGLMTAFLAGVGIAEDKTWTYNGVEYRLPKPVQEVQLPADIPETHTVVSGDCLWAISGNYLADPYLWPLVWEENLDTISNPHLIYPGDIVKLPGGTVMAAENMPPAERQPTMKAFEGEDENGQTGDSEVPVGNAPVEREPVPFSVTTESNIVSSGFISEENMDGPKIISSENGSYDLSKEDIVFIDAKPSDGLNIDDHFYIVRKMHSVKHPISGRNLGYMYHIMGELQVLCANDSIVTGRISRSYQTILRGDFLIPREDIPNPLTLGSPPIDRCNPSSKKLPGTIVDSFTGHPDFTDAVIMAEGDIAYVDIGSRDGVTPGDYFTIFKREMGDPRLPRFVSGEVMVLKVRESTSVVVITESRTAVFLGDQIELRQ